jgi:DNA modification methylase
MAEMASIHADQTTIPSDYLSSFVIHAGNNLDVLPTLPDNSVDSIVTDPPYELGFMGKKWDNSGIAYSVELWTECLRVLKPGGHLLAFSGSRTYHRMVVAIEDAGFEVRDMISWISNKTFPKSLDVSKAIDKAAGAQREVIRSRPLTGTGKTMKSGFHQPDGSGAGETIKQEVFEITAPSTPEAQKWQGWGTGLKPTVEPIVMARKPLIGTVSANVLEYGTGALNIDGSRIGTTVETWPSSRSYPFSKGEDGAITFGSSNAETEPTGKSPQGRWPANVILDEYSAGELDEQSGVSKSGMRPPTGNAILDTGAGWNQNSMTDKTTRGFQDTGGASRFFYVAKASKRDRNEGLEGSNLHPTVKPTTLMRYLVKLVTPPGGTVLDPFTGSGSTGKAAILEGFDFIGIEMTEEYLPIIDARLKHAEQVRDQQEQAKDEGLF